jgi:hypothetical protein
LNPDLFIIDVAALTGACYKLPFSCLDLLEVEWEQCYAISPIEFSHSLTEQIGGQLAAGFRRTSTP